MCEFGSGSDLSSLPDFHEQSMFSAMSLGVRHFHPRLGTDLVASRFLSKFIFVPVARKLKSNKRLLEIIMSLHVLWVES